MKQYYVVRWGDKPDSVIRGPSGKDEDPRGEALRSFGLVAENMYFVALGTNRREMLRNYRLLRNHSEWWRILPSYLLDASERAQRALRYKNSLEA